MKGRSNPLRSKSLSDFLKTEIQITLFDQQDGKLVRGVIIGATSTCFSLQCTDGQVRKFDIEAMHGYKEYGVLSNYLSHSDSNRFRRRA